MGWPSAAHSLTALTAANMLMLLPDQYRIALKKDYAKRWAVTLCVALCVSLALFLAALVPAYAFVTARRDAVVEQLAQVKDGRASGAATSSLALVETVTKTVEILAVPTLSVIAVIDGVAETAGSGITVREINVTSDDFGRTMRAEVSGSAATRQGLIDFAADLRESEQFEDARVPVSALVKDSDIPFSMTVTVTPIQ
jgi:hypothetical protein